jgi:hypothetical protein
MYRVKVERVVPKPIDVVFDMLTTHANYGQFPGVVEATLLEEGSLDKNGVGALRYIDGGKMRLKERIVKYERPTLMEYNIESSEPFFIELKLGQISLEAIDNTTRVVWKSEGWIKVPIIGFIMDKMFEKQFAKAFGAILKHISKV